MWYLKKKIRDLIAKAELTINLVMVAVTFLMIAFNLGYIVHNQIVCYDSTKVLVGCLSLYTMIHLNKSIGG